jgi:glucokinase
LSVRVPILEIGGTHVTAAWVHTGRWQVSDVSRQQLDGHADAADLIAAFAATGARLGAPAGAHWGVAMPGPFDYERGIARFAGVGKFDHLAGADIRAALTDALPTRPGSISFINDASAFLVGEWLVGAAHGTATCAAVTLGTGVGSAFLDHGTVIDHGPTVPPDGEVHLLRYQGRPLEEWVSRRAIRRDYAIESASRMQIDVREIAERARSGDQIAGQVFTDAFRILGETVGPWLHRFGAQVLVIGGSISRSWDLIAGPLAEGLSQCASVPVTLAEDPERAAFVGAAFPAAQRIRG